MMKVLLLSLASMLVGSATAAADLVRYDESPREYPRIVQDRILSAGSMACLQAKAGRAKMARLANGMAALKS